MDNILRKYFERLGVLGTIFSRSGEGLYGDA